MPNYNLFEKLKSFGITPTEAQLEEIKSAAEKDGANTTGKPNALDIKLFKSQFLFFANSQGYAKGCAHFITQLDACNTPGDVMRLFKSYGDDFAEALDIDEPEDNSSNVEDLEYEISELKDELADYEEMFGHPDDYRLIDKGSILFQWKVKLFFENIDKFSFDEIKDMFENKKNKAA